MKVLVFTVAVVVFLVGVIFNFSFRDKLKEEVVEQTFEILSQESENREEEKNFENEEKMEENLESTEIFVILTPTFIPTIFENTILDYQYPNSEIINSSNNPLFLTSTDETDAIIDWYKEKIGNEGMNIKTFVTTKVNDEVLSKLVGVDGQKEIRIEILKTNGKADTEISVVFQESD